MARARAAPIDGSNFSLIWPVIEPSTLLIHSRLFPLPFHRHCLVAFDALIHIGALLVCFLLDRIEIKRECRCICADGEPCRRNQCWLRKVHPPETSKVNHRAGPKRHFDQLPVTHAGARSGGFVNQLCNVLHLLGEPFQSANPNEDCFSHTGQPIST